MSSGEATSFDEIVPDARTGEARHVWSLKFPVRDAEGRGRRLGGVSLDVTDRERATRELAAARALFETVFASAPVGMLVSRVQDDGSVEVIQCNPAFASMLGREPSELLGSSVRRSCTATTWPSAAGCSTTCSRAARRPASCASSTPTGTTSAR